MASSFNVDLCTFSPNGLYLACLVHTEKQILIRNCDDGHKKKQKEHYDGGKAGGGTDKKFKVEHKFSLKSSSPLVPVDSLQWSPDSCFIATSCKKFGVLSIFSIMESGDVGWRCKLTLGDQLDLESFRWGWDARHLLCVSKDFLLLSVWSLRSKHVQYIKGIAPITSYSTAGLSYSPDGSLLAIAQASPSKTQVHPFIAIYSTSINSSSSKWSEKIKFPVSSKDLAGISWSPSTSSESEYLCLWDSHLFSNLYVYDTRNGQLIRHYSPYGMTSSGFRTVQWAPSGDFLVCTAENKNELHVLNGLTFGVLIHDVLEPDKSTCTSEKNEEVKMGHCEIFYEANKIPSLGINKYHRISKWPSSSLSLEPSSLLDPINSTIPKTYCLLDRPLKSSAFTRIKISPDSSLLACTTPFYPKILWIYDLITVVSTVAILIHQNPVVDFDWNLKPTNSLNKVQAHITNQLAIICCSSTAPNLSSEVVQDCPCHQKTTSSRGLIYFWTSSSHKSTSSAFIHNTAAKFTFSGIEWSPQGDILLIKDDLQRVHLFNNL